MKIDLPPSRPRAESIIPMINVVFLLLIFFLLSAQITGPTPFELTPPKSKSELLAEDFDVLFISAKGELAYNGQTGDAVWPEIGLRNTTAPMEIRADENTPATQVAKALRQLRGLDIMDVQIIVNGG